MAWFVLSMSRWRWQHVLPGATGLLQWAHFPEDNRRARYSFLRSFLVMQEVSPKAPTSKSRNGNEPKKPKAKIQNKP
jgi:hypothetical protein